MCLVCRQLEMRTYGLHPLLVEAGEHHLVQLLVMLCHTTLHDQAMCKECKKSAADLDLWERYGMRGARKVRKIRMYFAGRSLWLLLVNFTVKLKWPGISTVSEQ